MSYQAVVRDAENRLVVNQQLTVVVTVNDGQHTYTETQSVRSNANGLISLLIGGGDASSGSWGDINWKTAAVDTTISVGGTQIASQLMPLSAVPIAMYSHYADSVNPNVVARQIHDTADVIRQEVGNVSEEFENLANRLAADSANLKDNYYNKDNINDTITDILGQIPTVPANVGAFTNDKGYLTNADLSAYATLDKLKNDSTYLKGLIDANTGNISGLTADLNANYYNKTQVNDTLDEYYTKSKINDTLNEYAKTSDIPVEKKFKATTTENQTTFTLTEAPNTTHYFVKLFINGIMVGDHEDGVITVDGTTVTYVPGQNGGNQLRAGDRVVIYYFK